MGNHIISKGEKERMLLYIKETIGRIEEIDMVNNPMNVFSRHRVKYIFYIITAVLTTVYLFFCVSMRITERSASFTQESCMLYYIVNVDGMKGLGHSIILFVNEDGCGTVFSFNGMQRNLGESLLGKSGVGKMSMETMTREETENFLKTGDLDLDADQLTDNYDLALYRPVSAEAYQTLLDQTAPYMEAEKRFSLLYKKWVMEEDAGKRAEYEQALEQLGKDQSLPLYQIYTNNCDHAARLLVSSVDTTLEEYSGDTWRMTPNGNLKAFAQEAEDWGVLPLGEQSLWEKLLMFLVIF